jgi:hypothetical protein
VLLLNAIIIVKVGRRGRWLREAIVGIHFEYRSEIVGQSGAKTKENGSIVETILE